MVPVYAISTVLGVLGIIGWITAGMAASAVAGKDYLDPEVKFGFAGRAVVAAVAGFGLAGMSASFGGWNAGLAFVAAVAGALLGIASARYLGVEEDPDGDSA